VNEETLVHWELLRQKKKYPQSETHPTRSRNHSNQETLATLDSKITHSGHNTGSQKVNGNVSDTVINATINTIRMLVKRVTKIIMETSETKVITVILQTAFYTCPILTII